MTENFLRKFTKATSKSLRDLRGLLFKNKPQVVRGSHPSNSKPLAPTKADTALLPPFPGLPIQAIVVPVTEADFAAATAEILAAGVAGFDTESKPTFRVGEKSDGPHVVQFALARRAFIFQLHHPACRRAVIDLLQSDALKKVGFGLKSDHAHIQRKFGVLPRNVLDLDQIFRKRGYRGQIGVRGAVGALLGQRFRKSKTITTSNWAQPHLTPNQLLYAANDAYAALKIHEALES